jgi:hypothetical protein
MTKATGTFTVGGWDEAPYDEAEGGPKLARAAIVYAYAGDLEAEGRDTILLTYYDDGGSASYVGHERVTGRLGERDGSFVVEIDGTYGDGVARGSWRIVEGSGRGELAGITGEGGAEAAQGKEPYTWWLDYDLPATTP